APKSPTGLATFITDKDELTTKQVIGAYYAKGADNFHHLSERLGAEVGKTMKWFSWSLLALFGALALLVFVSTKPYTGSAMSGSGNPQNPLPSTPSTTPAPSPAAATPTTPTPAPSSATPIPPILA